MARELHARISDSLWQALHDRARTSGESISHVVQSALAEALDVDHHSLFQVSTSGAIVEGLYQGCVSVADLRRHGNLGLGTFENLDGEMILVDGHCYQARADGSVSEAPDDELTPFAVVVDFVADEVKREADITSWADFTARLDGMRTSANAMVAFRARGVFASLDARAACTHAPGTSLVAAVADQGIFHFESLPATIVGTWSPEYTRALAIAGYHAHAISDDRSKGGHVFDLRADELIIEVHRVSDIHIALPETQAFLEADLSGDHSADLAITEHGVST